LTGTLAPPVALVVVQSTLLLAATSVVTDTAPLAPLLLVAAVIAGTLQCSALSFVTAAYTRTPETATVTVAPVLGALFGGAMWTAGTPAAQVTWPMLLTGGGAVAHLARVGWDGVAAGVHVIDVAHAGPALAVTVVLTAAILAAATKLFHWDPRR